MNHGKVPVFFPVPERYREWFVLFHRLEDMGHKVYSIREERRAFILFDTEEEAVEFKLKHL